MARIQDVLVRGVLAVGLMGCGADGLDDSQDPNEEASESEGADRSKPDSSRDSQAGGSQGSSDSSGDEDPNDDQSDQEDPSKQASPDKKKGKQPKDKDDWDKMVDRVFPDDRVVSINIEFGDGGLAQMLSDWKEKQEKTYQKTTLLWDEQRLSGSGTRLKGYSTLMAAGGAMGPGGGGRLNERSKLPLKLNFDRFGGERLHYMDKVSLGTNAFDKSQMRERLSVKMFRRMGVPSAKTAFATVALNDNPVGLYTLTQNIDKRFLKQHFGTKDNADDGNLYKCVALDRMRRPGGKGGDLVCSLRWQGNKKSDYLRERGCATGYSECGLVLKTNEEDSTKNDYSDLIHFLDVLNNAKDAEFEKAIDEVFEVDFFLRFLAVTVGMVNLDSYLGRINNYYLYHRPDTGKFIMLPWDHNMSYGHYSGHRSRSELTEYPVQDPLSAQRKAENYPLIQRILAVPAYKKRYLEYVERFVDEHFTKKTHKALIEEFEALIREPLDADPNRRFSMEEFDEALGDQDTRASTGMGRQYNLMDFVSRRISHIRSELQ